MAENNFKEAVCVDVNRIYDIARDQDCLEDLRVFFCDTDNCLVERANDCRCKKCEIAWIYLDTEPVGFNKGCYFVKVKFYFKCTFDVYLGVKCPTEITGMATYEKKCVLYGSEGTTKTYSSEFLPGADNTPSSTNNSLIATIEVVEPIVLGCRLVERCNIKGCETDFDPCAVPSIVGGCFPDCLCQGMNCEKRLLVSLGIFSIVRLERKVQLLIPAYDFCIPDKSTACVSGQQEEPCELFKCIKFPTEQFYPSSMFNEGGMPGTGKCTYQGCLSNTEEVVRDCTCTCK